MRRSLPLVICGLVGACSEDPVASPGAAPLDASTQVPPGGDGGPDASILADGGPAPEAGVPPKGPLFAFTGSSDGKIRVFAVDVPAGTLAPRGEVGAGTNPSFLAVDTKNARVFAVDESSSEVLAFGFDPKTAAFTPRGKTGTLGAGPAHVSVSPSGAHVLVANYTGGSVAVFPVDAAGSLGAAADTKSPGPKAHLAITSANGAYAFVPCLGANIIAQYTFTSGKLAPNDPASVSPPAGAGPRHLAFHPGEKWAFGINETASTMTTYAYEATTGKLAAKDTVSTLPAGTTTPNTCAEVAVHPAGGVVYGSNRGHDSVAVFTLDAPTGKLTLAANEPTRGQIPRSFALDDTGTLLVVANQRSATAGAGNLAVFRVDGAGKLAPVGSPITGVGSPAFVGLFRF
jgi:6-phosphogluconolactonase